MKKLMLLSLILTLCTGQSFASYIIFEDNFDSYTRTTNWNGSTIWTVTDGSVDLIGNGYFLNIANHGLFVDMEGSTAGTLEKSFDLKAGTYMLSYDLAGSQRSGYGINDTVQIQIGSLSTSHTLAYNDPFRTFTETFSVLTDGSYSLSFEGMGLGDVRVGLLLDNVKVALVPVPATILLGFLGLGIGGWKLRKSL